MTTILLPHAETFEITGAANLDPIQVTWCDYEPGKGRVTVVCFDRAWSTYFNAMSGKTVKEFFLEADTPYLVKNLAIRIAPFRIVHREEEYLRRVVEAVKDSVRFLNSVKAALDAYAKAEQQDKEGA